MPHYTFTKYLLRNYNYWCETTLVILKFVIYYDSLLIYYHSRCDFITPVLPQCLRPWASLAPFTATTHHLTPHRLSASQSRFHSTRAEILRNKTATPIYRYNDSFNRLIVIRLDIGFGWAAISRPISPPLMPYCDAIILHEHMPLLERHTLVTSHSRAQLIYFDTILHSLILLDMSDIMAI
jgi:hypothetical protein